MESALARRVVSLRDNPRFSDLEILTPSRSYHGHKLVLSARSCDWGKGQDLSSHVLDWRDFSDRTCEDIIDYLYTDKVNCLEDKLYDDVRVIELFSAASFFSLSELSDRCERALEESKLRYPLPNDSPAILMKVALQASKKNLKKPVKRSLLLSKNESKIGFPIDTEHDHCYPGLPLQVQSKTILKKKTKKRQLKAKLMKNSTKIDRIIEHSEASSLQDNVDTEYAKANERKCQISLSPDQDAESEQQCRIQLKRQCQTTTDVEKQCQQVFEDECHSVPEQSCVNVPGTIQGAVHEKQCTPIQDQACAPDMEKICTVETNAQCEAVTENKRKTIQDEVCSVIEEMQCFAVHKQECRVRFTV